MGRGTKYGERMLRKLKPFFIQNSIIPRIFSKFAPIEIWAITIFPFVFLPTNAKATMNYDFK